MFDVSAKLLLKFRFRTEVFWGYPDSDIDLSWAITDSWDQYRSIATTRGTFTTYVRAVFRV